MAWGVNVQRWVGLLWLVGCVSTEVPDRLLAVDGYGGDYALTEVSIPELTDPRRMQGSLGNGEVGGVLLDEGGRVVYRGGGPLVIDYVVQDDVGVPLDGDAILLWSYYRSLASARQQLDEVGISTDRVFPVDFVFQPQVEGFSLVATNAAYVAGGGHRFLLLADTVQAPLPLAANPLVIRHELGHAVFQDVVAGGVFVYDQVIFTDARVAALQEGFADAVATLLLDDPDVLGQSLPSLAAARDVTGDATLAEAAPVDEDPYSRGTVHASFVWDLRELSTRELALRATVDGLVAWAERQGFRDDDDPVLVDRYARLVLEAALAEDPSLEAPLCEAFVRRFGSFLESRCS